MAVLRPDVFASFPSQLLQLHLLQFQFNLHILGRQHPCRPRRLRRPAYNIATPAMNPLNWHDTTPYTSGSPEGQDLVFAAWRDCVYAEVCGNPLAASGSSGSGGTTTTGSASAGAATTTTNSRRMAKKRMHGGLRRALDIFGKIRVNGFYIEFLDRLFQEHCLQRFRTKCILTY